MKLEEVEQSAVDAGGDWAAKHIDQYLATEGEEVVHRMADDLILLYTIGRKTGDIRRVPVVHYADGEDLIVIASKGGAPEHPAWFHNLVDEPQVWVRRKSELFEARARPLEGEEYDQMWNRITDWRPGFQEYQERTERQIPLVRLSPI